MYLVAIVLLMLVLPAASVAIEASLWPGEPDVMMLIGKWFTFWAVGVRLLLAGAMQTLRPQFTAQSIFSIRDPASLAIVREVGFGNLAIGTLGLASLIVPEWVVPAALAGGLYYGLAGAGHVVRKTKNRKEWLALISDLVIGALLGLFVIRSLPASAEEPLSAADRAWIDKCIADRAIEQHDPDKTRAYCACMHGIVEDNEPFTPMELERAYPPAHVICLEESGLANDKP